MSHARDAQLSPFDVVDYLDDEEVISEYLSVALENPDSGVFLDAVRDVARARGMTEISALSGLGRESLYKSLRRGASPRFDTVRNVLNALGVRLAVLPGQSGSPPR